MNINVIKTFCDLVDTGSFSRAADSNYISQSAVSQQLAKLERDLSVQLISRGGGMVAPTEAGKAFYRGAREILRRYEQMLGEVRSASDAVRGVLRVGTIYSVGFYLLDPYVREFITGHPEVHLHVEYTGWNHICAAIIGGEMDLGVVACPETNRSLEIVPLVDEELVAVLPPEHDLAGENDIEPQQLNDEDFVAFEANIPTRRHIDKLLKGERVRVNVTLEFDNIELLKRAIMVGSGVSILPKGNVELEASRGDLTMVPIRHGGQWVRPIGVLRRRGRQPGPAEQQFLAILGTKKK
ncbi:MAG: LysR family transcriptional regulator [Planctomycetes bacterium]|jgi:DNA-binding transcriptional LysR family regulator|nr:LysR family transcriptional regulator [Phycisphaerae bacterium]NBB94435.1 LysR family transcriptional regulator [Planctomycetota bacterium]